MVSTVNSLLVLMKRSDGWGDGEHIGGVLWCRDDILALSPSQVVPPSVLIPRARFPLVLPVSNLVTKASWIWL